jgi:hypothetical protein
MLACILVHQLTLVAGMLLAWMPFTVATDAILAVDTCIYDVEAPIESPEYAGRKPGYWRVLAVAFPYWWAVSSSAAGRPFRRSSPGYAVNSLYAGLSLWWSVVVWCALSPLALRLALLLVVVAVLTAAFAGDGARQREPAGEASHGTSSRFVYYDAEPCIMGIRAAAWGGTMATVAMGSAGAGVFGGLTGRSGVLRRSVQAL